MSLNFFGSFRDLKGLLKRNGIDGRWEKKPNGVKLLRRHNGSVLSWSSTQGTIWCQGPGLPQQMLQDAVERALNN